MQIDGEEEADDLGNFESAFAEFAKGDAPPEQAAPTGEEDEGEAGAEAPADQPAGDPAPQEAAPSDPWANATPEQIAARDAIIAERDRAVHSDQSQRGRIGALQRKVTELSAAPPQAQEKTDEDASKIKEQIAQIKEDYPDLGGPILALIEGLQAKVDALAPTVATIAEDRSAAVVQGELAQLTARHSDWREVANSPDWKGWLAEQPASVQAQADSEDAREVSAALTLFKTERGIAMGAGGIPPKVDPKPDARRTKQLEGSRQVSTRAAPAATGAPDDFDGAFAHFASKKRA